MALDSPMQRRLSLFSLVMAVVTSTIGSGWLFAPYLSARLAGPGSLLAWLAGGLMAFVIALVFAELGALISSSGALAQVPLLTHGRLAGFLGGWTAWLGYVALPTIEVLATVEYLGTVLPWLMHSHNGSSSLTPAGLGCAALLLLLFGWINLSGIGALARWINGLTVWKLLVPLATALVLIAVAAHPANLQVGGVTVAGGLEALSTGGILFSLLGFRTAMDLAGEARQPQRDVPLAMGLGLGLSLAIYLVLQLAFLLAVPPANLVRGWGGLTLTAQGGPLVAVVLAVGLPLLATLLITDAVVSPSATAMTYMGTAARVNWMMANLGLLPVRFAGLNRAGVPAPALLATLLVGLGLLLAGPSWSGAVSLVTAALVMALAMGPVSLLALRRQRPDLPRPYRLPLAEVLCPLAFVVASWAIVWCGWSSLRLTVPLVLLPTLLQLVRGRPADGVGVLWWFPYLIGLGLAAALLGPGRPWALPSWQLLLVSGGFAVAMFPLALASRLEEPSPEAGLRL